MLIAPLRLLDMIAHVTAVLTFVLRRTNLPAQIMNFPDYMAMIAQEPGSVGHRDVLTYLKDYAKHFDICQYIHVTQNIINMSYLKIALHVKALFACSYPIN
jgi:adenylate kinase